MKILFTRFPLESAYGGAEVQTIALMRGLMARGHAVAFLGSCRTLLALCREHGIPAAELKIGPPPVTKSGAVTFVWRKMKMKRLLVTALSQFYSPSSITDEKRRESTLSGAEGNQVDAVCMLSLSEKLLLTSEASKKGAKVYWIEHDRVGNWLTRNPWLGLLRRQSKKAVTVAVSSLSKRVYDELEWEGRIVAIPNGVDADRLQSSTLKAKTTRPELTEKDRPFTLGCVARLSKEKGVDLLIEALSLTSDVTLRLLGKGKEEKALRKLADALGLSDRIEWILEETDVASFYRSIDAIVLPSRDHDPFGLAPAEAMTLGIPAIITDACGLAGEVQDGHDALIADAGSVSALAHAIERLKDTRKRESIARAGQKTALEKFSIETMVLAYEKLLAS